MSFKLSSQLSSREAARGTVPDCCTSSAQDGGIDKMAGCDAASAAVGYEQFREIQGVTTQKTSNSILTAMKI
jgi:hypothetical protein